MDSYDHLNMVMMRTWTDLIAAQMFRPALIAQGRIDQAHWHVGHLFLNLFEWNRAGYRAV